MVEPEVKFSPEQQAVIDKIIGERLARDRSNRETDPAILTLLNEVKTQLAEEKNKRLELEKVSQKSTIDNLKKKIAADMKINIPESLLQYVEGTDEVTLKASIEKIAKDLGTITVGSGTNPPTAGQPGSVIYTKEMLNSMKPEDINKNYPEIQRQLSAGLIK